MTQTIGKRIQSLRKQKGMSQQDLSDVLNITRQTISKWESDQTLPDLNTLIKMAELFNVSIAYIVGVEENNKSISEIYDLMQNILNNQQKSNKKRDFIQITTIILCILSLLLNIFGTSNFTLEPSVKETPSPNNNIISTMYDYTKDRFNQLEPSPYFSEESYLRAYYYELDEMMVRLTGKLYLNEYSEDTTVAIILEKRPFFISTPYEIQRELTHSKNNEYILDTKVPLVNYDKINLSITQGDGTTNFISLEDSMQHNFLYHALFAHLNLMIPTDESGHLQLNTLVFDPTLLNTSMDNTFWDTLDTTLTLTLQNEMNGHQFDEFTVNLKEKTIHQLKESLPTDTDITICFKFDITYPYHPYLYLFEGHQNLRSTTYYHCFGNSFNTMYTPFEEDIYLTFTIDKTNEDYRIAQLPFYYEEEVDTYLFKE